jgi:Ribbon-helix-helix protein
MELKTARLTLLIDPNKKAAFERLCAQQDRTASQVVRQFIRDYLAQHGVEYEASGASSDQAEPARRGASPPMKQPAKRAAPPSAKRPAARRKA